MDQTPQEHEARRHRIPENLLTEPMTIQELADLFGIGRNKMSLILKSYLPGAVPFGGLWRVRVADMPPIYFESRQISLFDASTCTDLHNQPTSNPLARENGLHE